MRRTARDQGKDEVARRAEELRVEEERQRVEDARRQREEAQRASNLERREKEMVLTVGDYEDLSRE